MGKYLKARTAFALNKFDLEKDGQAGPALRRIEEILSAKKPYSLIKEASGHPAQKSFA